MSGSQIGVRMSPPICSWRIISNAIGVTIVIAKSSAIARVMLICVLTSAISACNAPNEVPIMTMDSTSHSYHWEIDTLGEGSGSVFYDVAIVNDTLAYAVGEISVRDSSGNFQVPSYNLARWNGHGWELSIIDRQFNYGRTYSIVAFGADDIWVGAGGLSHWNGKNWELPPNSGTFPLTIYIRTLGGASASSMYCAGESGGLVRFDGRSWVILATGTEADIQDIWTGSNPLVGGVATLIVAASKFNNVGQKLLRVVGTGSVDSLAWTPDPSRPPHSVWFEGSSPIYMCGAGIVRFDGSTWTRIEGTDGFYTNRIRGTASNDVIAVGDFGYVVHYNGSTWHSYPEVMLSDGQYNSVAMKGNLVIAVGSALGRTRAVALIGRRVR